MSILRRNLICTITPIAEGPPFMLDISRGGPDLIVGTPVSGLVFVPLGGVPPYAFSIIGGALPPGLTLGADGKITGIPTTQGYYEILAQAQDGASQLSPPRTVTFHVLSGIRLRFPKRVPPIGAVGITYDFRVLAEDATGNTAGITYSLVSTTNMPAGLSIASSGQVVGSPTAAGYSYPAIRATKGSLFTDFPFALQVNAQFTSAGMTATLSPGLQNMIVGAAVAGEIQLTWPAQTMPVGIAPYR